MEFNTRKKIVGDEINKIYKKYNSKGLLSVYWYGSGLSNDFTNKSDIDIVGISEDSLSMEYEKKILKELQLNTKLDIHFRIIYLSELNGGKIKSFLNKVLPVKVLLRDFDKYINIIGTKYSKNSFKEKEYTLSELIKFEKKCFKNNLILFNQDNSKGQYLIKSILYYMYYYTLEETKSDFNFSYNTLPEKVLNKYTSLTLKCLEIKSENYNRDKITKLLRELNEELK